MIYQYITHRIRTLLRSPHRIHVSPRMLSAQFAEQYKPYIDIYRKTSNISHTLVGNKIVDNSDVVGASPVGAAPITSSFST